MSLCRLLAGHQSHLMWLLLIFVVASIIDLSTPAPVTGHQDFVEVTLLEEAWNSDHRSRRDADSNLPDRLSFAVPVASDRAVLSMTRSRLLPVIMSDEKSTRAANSFSEGAAVYTDLSSSSSMIVKRESGSYMLNGSFVHANVAWTLRYETRHKRDAPNATSVPHLVSRYVRPKRAFDEVSGNETSQKDAGVAESGPSLETTIQHIVEVAFIVDYADYKKWVKNVGLEDTPREMRLWYTFVAESVNIRYQNIKDPDIAIKTTITVLRILSNESEAGLFMKGSPSDDVFEGVEGLDLLAEWCSKEDSLPPSDHYMLFTGLNLTHPATEVDGIAASSGLCSYNAVSITQNDFHENTGHTAAHELAHSLSANHDEETGERGCTADYLYIMSIRYPVPINTTNVGNNWRFSSCTINSFKSFLRTVTCTRETNTERRDLPAPVPGERAGDLLSRDEQCKLALHNETSFFCESSQMKEMYGGIEGLCRGMFCADLSVNLCLFKMPQEYTSCGDKKWCRSGRCTDKNESNPITPLTNNTVPTAATTAEQPPTTTSSSEVTSTTTRQVTNGSSSQNDKSITRATSNSLIAPSTNTSRSQLSTPTSSVTTINFVTFALCLLCLYI